MKTTIDELRRLLGEATPLEHIRQLEAHGHDSVGSFQGGWTIHIDAPSHSQEEKLRNLVWETLERLPLLLDVVEAASNALAIHEDAACSCDGCGRVRRALAALYPEEPR